jgi:hypothetical protein
LIGKPETQSVRSFGPFGTSCAITLLSRGPPSDADSQQSDCSLEFQTGKETIMVFQPLATRVVLAVGCMLSAGTVQAQSPLNPFTWFGPTQPNYGSTPYCPNGNCYGTRSSAYAPSYVNCPGGICPANSYGGYSAYGNCPNGNCGIVGNCANGQCAPVNKYYGNVQPAYRTPSYNVPIYPTQPKYYQSQGAPSFYRGATGPTYQPDPWAVSNVPRTYRSYNPANSPFYP